MTKNRKKQPAAHIYHYGHYEETALKLLMSGHGTREFQVDQLLRNHKLVDLYKVVRQGLRLSEYSYSLKNVETFYMENRDAEVVSAVESVIFYEKWKLTRDPAILDSIRDYNEDDCRSTSLLHQWLLSIKPTSAACFFRKRFDYLFVDEAGQVSLANLVAMGMSTKNIVLLGDQMQLGQPIQGRHPEDSGESVLDFLMEGYATVPEKRGIFLPRTYRMHPDITRFISDVSYNGRLAAETNRAGQGLVFHGSNDFNLPETGIRFIPCSHDACSQSSIEETQLIRQLIPWLEKQSFRTKTGDVQPVTLEDILIVAP